MAGAAQPPPFESFQCLQIWRQSIPKVLSGIPQPAAEWLKKNGWDEPPTMDVVLASQYANTSAYAWIVAYLRPIATNPVVTKTRELPSGLPTWVLKEHLHWGRELQEATTDGVYSIRSKLKMPTLEFVDVAIDRSKVPVDTKPAAQPVQPTSAGPSERG